MTGARPRRCAPNNDQVPHHQADDQRDPTSATIQVVLVGLTTYAVDFDGDGHADLTPTTADAIGCVAHYLAEFGW